MKLTGNEHHHISKIVVLGLAFIILTSFYDAYLVFKYRFGIDELNPICDYLIQLEPNNASVFLITKVLLTLVVATILSLLYRCQRRVGLTAIVSIVVFQSCLMGFIHHSEPAKSVAQTDAPPTHLIENSPYRREHGTHRRGRRDFFGRPHHRPFRFDRPARPHRFFDDPQTDS